MILETTSDEGNSDTQGTPDMTLELMGISVVSVLAISIDIFMVEQVNVEKAIESNWCRILIGMTTIQNDDAAMMVQWQVESGGYPRWVS